MLLCYNKGYVKCLFFCPVISFVWILRVKGDAELITPVSQSGVSRPDLPVRTNSLRPPVCRPTKLQVKRRRWNLAFNKRTTTNNKVNFHFRRFMSKCRFVEFPRLHCTFAVAPLSLRGGCSKWQISDPVVTRMCFMFHYMKWTHSLGPTHITVLLSVVFKGNLSREKHKSSLKGAFRLNFEELNKNKCLMPKEFCFLHDKLFLRRILRPKMNNK